MKDRNVEVLLQNPLLVIATREEIRSKPVLENILRIMGKIIEENSAGMFIEVKSIGSEKIWDKNPPFSQIFIPYHKIDHILFT
jgi:hypothetical protein